MAKKSIMGGHNMGGLQTGQQGGRTAAPAPGPKQVSAAPPSPRPPSPGPASPMPAPPPMQITPNRTIKSNGA